MAEACYSYARPVFSQAMRVVSAITNTFPAVVTTTLDHLYITGAIVRIIITKGHGMPQINQQFGTIVVVSPTTFAIDIDATAYDAFVVPDLAKYTCSQCIPIGEDNNILTAAVQNVLPYSAS